ncbi:ribosomal L28e protein [Nitzschia inconspicua]|uniref:Ribosomal L28e protein n=1 Tax=Nitzschia inconspicua TaxID=303405 RepID=A0A9K3M8H8_9STRA|nr:ribosomal L28e protein [Nitzschia inconspicua]
MVSCPDALMWEITKGSNSFLMKRNGNTKRSGAIEFSTEKGNIKSLNQFKFSGIANSKVYDVVCTAENKAELIKKSASKAGSKPSQAQAIIPIKRSDFRRGEKTIKKNTSDVYYRRDLESAALAKWTKVYNANKRAKGVKKGVAVKKGRGKL